MRIKALIPVLVIVVGLLAASPVEAQFTKDWKDWYGHIQGGYTLGMGDYSDLADDGWTLGGDVTYYPADWPVGISMGIDHYDFDMTGDAKNFFESDGEISTWGFTGGVTWSPRLEARLAST